MKEKALEYHATGRAGKVEVITSKPCETAEQLSLAYTPGVAHPCLEIEKDPALAGKYTARNNLVAVISNGTAVLGLGNIGPLASKPVMEGKGVLFKRFADIDVFDLEVSDNTIEGMIDLVKKLEPTFGGINLEDIKAPECFEIERRLIAEMNIPVFHDDQHGTAIIATAGFINALEITNKKAKDVKIVFSGAGASAISVAKLLIQIGANQKNIIMCDSHGVIYQGRTKGMNPYKQEFAVNTPHRTIKDAMKGADVFIGLSGPKAVDQAMVQSMNKNPLIFAMANPTPEIFPEEIIQVRSDAIIATGRSDYPNQINNVLGFPFIFRGALDSGAKKINEEMKLAAAYALATLAKQEVPHEVRQAYNGQEFSFGRNYIIPKPFDYRVLTWVAPAVARAAMESGVATRPIQNLDQYAKELEKRIVAKKQFLINCLS